MKKYYNHSSRQLASCRIHLSRIQDLPLPLSGESCKTIAHNKFWRNEKPSTDGSENLTKPKVVGNKTKQRISKCVFQENKARQIFQSVRNVRFLGILRSSLSENIISCWTSICWTFQCILSIDSPTRSMKKRKMTLGKRLVLLDNPNKQFIFKLNSRTISYRLKWWIAFQKATKCWSINFCFSEVILCYSN